ncbi:hypothetical protein Mapa_001704 [Marchantia paleacea]|nr:hypothetical protein Mapa_001704 [Marchantia paleacea]
MESGGVVRICVHGRDDVAGLLAAPLAGVVPVPEVDGEVGVAEKVLEDSLVEVEEESVEGVEEPAEVNVDADAFTCVGAGGVGAVAHPVLFQRPRIVQR